MTWAIPISDESDRAHLVRDDALVRNGLVTTVCGKQINPDFATPVAARYELKCLACRVRAKR